MWLLKSGGSPRATRASLTSISGSTNGSRFLGWQWSVCSATEENPLDLVFHGGSGSTLEEIHEALEYGVVKMNIDTDTQYAFTRPIVDHVLRNYDGVLKVDGEVGEKKAYDPRAYLKQATAGMKQRVVEACADLRST